MQEETEETGTGDIDITAREERNQMKIVACMMGQGKDVQRHLVEVRNMKGWI